MSFIADRLDLFDSSGFRDAIERQKSLKDPVDLSVGVPEELTAEHIKAAGIRAIQEDKTTYTPSNGIYELREAIAQKLRDENKIAATADTVTVVPGLTTGQLLVYLAILNPGDEVIVMDPFYPPYAHLVSMIGATVTYVSTLPSFQPDIRQIEASITHRTKAIVVNSPNNPTGAVYPEETLRQIARIADEHNVLVISDEIYEHFIYDGEHFSIGSIYPNTITMNGFSKEFAMTGWRLGYISAPAEIINAINEIQQYVVFASSSIAQHAAIAALTKRPNVTDKYREKRDLVRESLAASGYKVNGLEGAYYAFVKAPQDMTDLEFVERAAEHDLIIVPGRAFSNLHGYVRLSYGTEKDKLLRGLQIFEEISKEINGETL